MTLSVANRALAWVVPIGAEIAALGRSIVLARLIGADELGQAMVLALALRLVEMVSDLGIERLLAQAPDGDTPAFLAGLHGAIVLRGIAMAAVLAAIAWPLAVMFNDGPDAVTYAALALVPLLRGFAHLGYRQRERRFDYRAFAAVELSASAAMLAGAALGALYLEDHRAIVVAVIAQGLTLLLASRCVAQTPYKVAFDPARLRQVWAYGAPLVANAALLFATLQADRLIVAAGFGWAAVAIYGTAMQLAYLPAQISGRAASALMAPRFRIALAEGRLEETGRRALVAYFGLGIAFFAGFATLAPWAIATVWGADFAPDTALTTGLAAAAALRIARTPLSQLAVSTWRTGDPARANLWRLAVLPFALAAAAFALPLASLAWLAACGEALAAYRGWQLYTRSTEKRPADQEVFA